METVWVCFCCLGGSLVLSGNSSKDTQGFREGEAELDGENEDTFDLISAIGFFFDEAQGLLFILEAVVALDVKTGGAMEAVVDVPVVVEEEGTMVETPVTGGGFLKIKNNC